MANKPQPKDRAAASAEEDANYIWQDREIRFDISAAAIACRKGEQEIDSISPVEDTKGNNGDKGTLIITNLRIIWLSLKDSRTNLSIGLNCIVGTSVKVANSRLRGNAQGLFVMTKDVHMTDAGPQISRFEFIFTSLAANNARMFTTTQAIVRSYETTRLYRDLKLRGAIIKDKALIMLPDEIVYSKVDGVWNLSSDQGNLGTCFVTNVRVVWHAALADNFNVSIPYVQIKSVRVRESKFGQALVIESSKKSGGYVLGFRLEPFEKMDTLFKEIRRMHDVFSQNPQFGVKYVVEADKAASGLQDAKSIPQDDIEIVDQGNYALGACYADDGDTKGDREVVYNADLGLAVEKLRDGVSIDDLWSMS